MYAEVKKALLEESKEACAVLFTHAAGSNGKDDRLVAARVIYPSLQYYSERTNTSAVLAPAFLTEITNEARASEAGLVLVHTHPFATGVPKFSSTDDSGERSIAEFLARRLPGIHSLALVVSPGGAKCRVIGTQDPVEGVQVGPDIQAVFQDEASSSHETVFDRQVAAFGARGQSIVRKLNVAIVGLGGTGSIIAQQLAYLGVRHFVLVDPDKVESHNLNRVVGASASDLGFAKVSVTERYIRLIRAESEITSLEQTIVDEAVAKRLISTDFIFCCTDSHSSRAVLNQLAYQYLIPCIDMGTGIVTENGRVISVAGRVQMLAPGLACLTCTNAIDARAVREELMTPEQRKLDPYFTGGGVPQPAVISLNSTVASLAITMFLGAVTGVPFKSRFQIYNAIEGTVRPVIASPDPQCIVCSKFGALSRGRNWPLPTRPSNDQ